jgi:hypothetical protein
MTPNRLPQWLPLLVLAACAPDASRGAELVPLRARQLSLSPAALEFTEIRGLALDSRGNLLVGDLGGQVMELAPDGALRRRIGRKGSGPGEFDAVDAVHVLPGDSLFVFDGSLERVTVFAPGSDRPVRTVPLGTSGYVFPYWVAPAGTDGALFSAGRRAFGDTGGAGSAPQQHESVRLLRPDGSLLRDSLLAVEQMETLVFHGEMEGAGFNPFGRRRLFAVGPGGRLYSAWNGTLDVQLNEADGRVLGVLHPRVRVSARPVSARERDSVAAALEGSAFPAAAVQRAFAAAQTRSWPLFQEMFVDDSARVWLGLLGDRGGPIHWRAFSADGAPRAALDLPANESLRMVRAGRAYAVRRDRDDVPRVVVYALTAGGSGR